MENIEVGLMVGIGWIGMTQLEMVGSWICHIGELINTGSIIVHFPRGTMIIITIILTGGVIGDIF